ncbi:MAG: hypothetical protein C4K47_09665 [Candidatus Thorarchaeota archaeon]|nr:MAG: hypothetical protein C4K47_09665 [Candidatus Thorarchaeota archaeon]
MKVAGRQLRPVDTPPKWAYLVSSILVVMSGVLGVTLVFVLLIMFPAGTDIRIPLLFIILPLSILIPVTTLTMALWLTKRRDYPA